MASKEQAPLAAKRPDSTSLLEIQEFNEADELVATYVESPHQTLQQSTRLDVVRPAESQSRWQVLLDAFLPVGYPHSVSDDYLEYQVYDSLQAFASSIAGLIASRAVLKGVGVGDAEASPTTALMYSIVQGTLGRIVTILFAWQLGKALEPECKMWRLAADVFNDAATIIDCLSPMFPRMARVLVLSCSSTLRALCGVAAGSSKASLSAHFARAGNLGELNAKDSSQETVISLMGMLAGTVVVARVPPGLASWVVVLVLLGMHLALNYKAVRAVKMRTLNRQRCNIVVSTLVDTGRVLTPDQVATAERVFEIDGMLRWGKDQCLGHCEHGATMSALVDMLRPLGNSGDNATKPVGGRPGHHTLRQVADVFAKQKYIIWYDAPRCRGLVVLKRSVEPLAQLQAWMAVLLAAKKASASASPIDACELVAQADVEARILLDQHVQTLRDVGWNLDAATLETRAGRRIAMA